ncbi:MAG: hypothetical protein KKC51_04935 [Verrucomicrobia bacterium]|nr:hypothetical protein [Verrucomicrobiota bacterium]
MKTTASIVFALLMATAAVHGRDDIVITATKKSLDEFKGSEQDLWRGTSRSVEKQVLYEVEVKSRSPAVPSDLTVEWLILVEGAGGRVFPGTLGRQSITVATGQSATLQTEPVKLVGREWRGGPRPGTVEDDIAGYGIRVLATDGTLLAEKYEPPSVKSRVDWKLLDASQSDKILKQPPRLRPLRAP